MRRGLWCSSVQVVLGAMRNVYLMIPMMALLAVGCGGASPTQSNGAMMEKTNEWAPLESYVKDRLSEENLISEGRKEELNALAQFVATARDTGEAKLIFICTHNSRRSHFSQVWSQLAAHHFGMDSAVSTFSGGTEATAFNERSVAALRRAGFDIHPASFGENPKYAVGYALDRKPMVCYSKKYNDHDENPSSGFAAVMTCSDADEKCPIVYGAEARFSTPYVDPKVSDGSAEEGATYDERCAQIAREMLYMMGQSVRPN